MLNGFCRHAVDPSHLREALDALPGHDFKLGEMNDPNEVLGAIFECLAAVPHLRGSRDASRAMVDEVFGLQLSASVRCPACHVVSHIVRSHVEYFHVITATLLRRLKEKGGPITFTLILIVWPPHVGALVYKSHGLLFKQHKPNYFPSNL